MAIGSGGVGANQIATKAQMVGFTPQPALQTKTKEAEIRNPVDDLREAEGDTRTTNRRDARDVQQRDQQPQQRADRTQQRRISLDTPQQKTQTTETEQTTEQTAAATDAGAEQGEAPQPTRVLLDNSRSIQFQFNSNRQAGDATSDTQQQQPLLQKQRFLNTLRNMVQTEYQQYVKSDDQLYSRRNLREIMVALNSNDDPNVSRLRKTQDDTNGTNNSEPAGELEGYNKFNAMRAQRSLQVVQTHQTDASQFNEPLSLVA